MNEPAGGEELAPHERSESDLASDDFQEANEPEGRSLREDVEALIDDGRTYLEAELMFQKTRAAYVADRAKGAVVWGAIAAIFAVLALIGLTVGLIAALTPVLTAWGASALVVGLLLAGAVVAGRSAAKRWKNLMAAIEEADK